MTWKSLLEEETRKPYYRDLLKAVRWEREENTIYPPEPDVFNAFRMTPLNEVQVVILGQDPYHGPGQAHGLSFSSLKRIPPSLHNIFKEVRTDFAPDFNPQHGDLTGWAKQGVLLLNSWLTVRKGHPGSHSNLGWDRFTDEVIKRVDAYLRDECVYMLWGQKAQSKAYLIGYGKILRAAHPSPRVTTGGFSGCKHFSRANDYLMKRNKPGIDWSDI